MLRFKQVTSNDEALIAIMTSWYNDDSIQHFIKPNFQEGPFEKCTQDSIKESVNEKNKYYYIAFDDEHPIGEVSITVDPEHLARKVENTGWISILIGEGSYRKKGYGDKLMHFIERTAKELGLKRIELGVFDFNENAIKFYQKLGYLPFYEFKDFTYWNETWHSDIRMEKYL